MPDWTPVAIHNEQIQLNSQTSLKYRIYVALPNYRLLGDPRNDVKFISTTLWKLKIETII